jgi:F1F0 ATPase subunit 2
MTTNLLAAFGGFLLGLIFFGGLWLTVKRGLASPRPALLFLTSSLLRTAIVIGGFLSISAGDAGRLLLAVGGFVAAKALSVALGRRNGASENLDKKEKPCI